ncbi:hypothetical protein [Microbacterium indicum]|uniref:hypothetical protein n=1 Tax=Microbacterium indicum TaxID=358100 RepID=UPI000423BED9|nr:hypothetical protein [Microbacterium indicum]
MRRAAAIGAILALAAIGTGGGALADEGDITVTIPGGGEVTADGEITDAVLRWGISAESGSGAFAGGCNFLSAGLAGDAGSAREWTEADGLYAASAGDVEIQKPDASGAWTAASWDAKCLDRSGSAVSASSLASSTESQLVITGGAGEATADGVEIDWSGSFTVAFYGGMSYWSATDPHLSLDASGDGVLTARLSGYASSRDDMSRWAPIAQDDVVLAEIRGADVASDGFAVVPEYLGVEAAISGQSARTAENAAYWGAFPASFLGFQERLGQAGYWMSTGGQRDQAKPATTLYVDFDARTATPPSPGSAPAPSGGSAVTQTALPPLASAPASAALTTITAAPATSTVTGSAPVAAAVVPAVVRSDAQGLIPESVAWLDRIPLPALAGGLAALIAAIAAMRLAGIPVFPWSKRSSA